MEHYCASAPTTTSCSSPQRGGGVGRELQLQGPRPTPLRVHKDSHRIRKPPAQARQPVIIYTVSPKVVHADPAEFMSVVQRLTGASSSSSSSQPPPPPPSLPFPFFPHHQPPSSMLPPALSFPFHVQAAAAAQQPQEDELLQQLQHSSAARLAAIAQPAARSGVHRGGLPPLPSILSPVPGSLPPIPPGFFSPPSGSAGGGGGGINLFGELISPAFPGGHGAFTGAAPPPMSSTQYFPAAAAPSPSTPYYWDLFNNHPNQL